ncbi:unnamed protein product [Prunus armeniaca]
MQSILLTQFILTRASIATTKGSASHTSSQKSTWIIDLGATDHMTFDPGQLISRKSFTPSMVSNANDILAGKTIDCGTQRDKLNYLDWALDSEIKVGQAFTTSGTRSEGERDKMIANACLGFPFSKLKGKSVPSFNSSIKWWRLSFMPESRFFVLTMAKNFSTMILTSSYKIMASYINSHAPILHNRMEWLKERIDIYWK